MMILFLDSGIIVICWRGTASLSHMGFDMMPRTFQGCLWDWGGNIEKASKQANKQTESLERTTRFLPTTRNLKVLIIRGKRSLLSESTKARRVY